jgi:hypothetical protein
MDDSLEPIVKKASNCLDKELFFSVHEDDKEPYWKIIFLCFICVKRIILLAGLID